MPFSAGLRAPGRWVNLTSLCGRSRRVISAAFSIGSLGPDKSNLLNGKGAINRLLSRDDCRLFAMRLASHDCAADECGPFPQVPPDPFDDRVFGSSIFHYWQNL
jgi:hypothetical protein